MPCQRSGLPTTLRSTGLGHALAIWPLNFEKHDLRKSMWKFLKKTSDFLKKLLAVPKEIQCLFMLVIRWETHLIYSSTFCNLRQIKTLYKSSRGQERCTFDATGLAMLLLHLQQ